MSSHRIEVSAERTLGPLLSKAPHPFSVSLTTLTLPSPEDPRTAINPGDMHHTHPSSPYQRFTREYRRLDTSSPKQALAHAITPITNLTTGRFASLLMPVPCTGGWIA